MIYKVKYSFDYGGKYYAPGEEINEEMYNIACAKHADRVYVEGVIPSSLKSSEEIEKEIAELELVLAKRKHEEAQTTQEADSDSDNSDKKSGEENEIVTDS